MYRIKCSPALDNLKFSVISEKTGLRVNLIQFKNLRSVFNIRADVDRTIQILYALIQISLETRELVPQILRLKFGPSDQNFNQFDLI